MSKITGVELQTVYAEHENIPGQIPFVSFDENDLKTFEKVDNEAVENSAENYLKGVILEARKDPEVVRVDAPKPKGDRKKIDQELSFKQLSSSSFISKTNFGSNYEIDQKYLPTQDWKNDRLEVFEYARNQVANHGGKLRSIRRESKKRPKLPIYPLPEPDDQKSWQQFIFGKTLEVYLSESGKLDRGYIFNSFFEI